MTPNFIQVYISIKTITDFNGKLLWQFRTLTLTKHCNSGRWSLSDLSAHVVNSLFSETQEARSKMFCIRPSSNGIKRSVITKNLIHNSILVLNCRLNDSQICLCLTHLWRMNFPILIIWMSPFLFLGAFGVNFYFSWFHFLMKIMSAFCGVTSGANQFAYVP